MVYLREVIEKFRLLGPRSAGCYRRTGKRNRPRRFKLSRIEEVKQPSAKLQQADFRFSYVEDFCHGGTNWPRSAVCRVQAHELFDFPHLSEHARGEGGRQGNERVRDLRAWTNPLLLKSTPPSCGIMRLASSEDQFPSLEAAGARFEAMNCIPRGLS